jgi:hypothetical protein
MHAAIRNLEGRTTNMILTQIVVATRIFGGPSNKGGTPCHGPQPATRRDPPTFRPSGLGTDRSAPRQRDQQRERLVPCGFDSICIISTRKATVTVDLPYDIRITVVLRIAFTHT